LIPLVKVQLLSPSGWVPQVDKPEEKAGLRQKVKVMVGGASVTQAYADRIGADGYGADAVAAEEKARALISTQPH